MLRDPRRGVLGARGLPHLLEAHDIGLEPVDPRDHLVPALGPPRLEQRARVELHHPQAAHPSNVSPPPSAGLSGSGRNEPDGLVISVVEAGNSSGRQALVSMTNLTDEAAARARADQDRNEVLALLG
jgi:hypothetical protein